MNILSLFTHKIKFLLYSLYLPGAPNSTKNNNNNNRNRQTMEAQHI